MDTITLLTVVCAGLLLLVGMVLFNTLVGRKNRVQFAFSGIDTQLKKRFDLIPNLIATVERYMQHEQQVLQQLTSLRSQAVRGTATTDELVQMDNQLTSALRCSVIWSSWKIPASINSSRCIPLIRWRHAIC